MQSAGVGRCGVAGFHVPRLAQAAPLFSRALRPLLKVVGAGPNPLAAADAWRRIEGFFGRYLAG